MDSLFCQSCGIPMNDPALLGTNKDGTDNHEYCIRCYKDGDFTIDITMEEIIENNMKLIDDFNKTSSQKISKAAAKAQLLNHLQRLKRWRK